MSVLKRFNRLMITAGVLTVFVQAQAAYAAENLEKGIAELATKIVTKSVDKGNRSIAIAPFPNVRGEYTSLSNYISDELVLGLFNVPDANIEIIERTQLGEIFKELSLSLTGTIDAKSIKQMGKVYGVDALVIGATTTLGDKMRINARMVDTETARVYSAAATSVPVTSQISQLSSQVMSQVASAPARPMSTSAGRSGPSKPSSLDGIFGKWTGTYTGSGGDLRHMYLELKKAALFECSGTLYFLWGKNGCYHDLSYQGTVDGVSQYQAKSGFCGSRYKKFKTYNSLGSCDGYIDDRHFISIKNGKLQVTLHHRENKEWARELDRTQ